MKILIYGINFAPELTGIGKYSAEMAQWLQEHGHEVRVVTAPPYYPQWSVHTGYHAGRFSRESWHGIALWRCPLWVPQRPSGAKRMLHLLSFALSSIPALLAQWRWKPDVMWLTEPPLFCTPAALLFSRAIKAKSWLHIQDYEVDAAFALGLLKSGRLQSFVLACERWLLRRFDRVSTISERMLERAKSKGVDPSRLLHLPNWVDISAIRPLQGPSPYRAELGIPDDAIVALYSGNMGGKQGIEILADAALLLKHVPTIHFVLCGNGPARDALMQRCLHLPNVKFIELQPIERLGELLGLADIHLLPQRADAADLVMPSKLTGMLSSGRPVLATAHAETELGKVVSQCGSIVAPEDAVALAERIEWLASHPDVRHEMGLRARRYAEEKISRESVLKQFETDLEACR